MGKWWGLGERTNVSTGLYQGMRQRFAFPHPLRGPGFPLGHGLVKQPVPTSFNF